MSETTSGKNCGLHTNAFNTSIQSHEFSDGKGTITFNGDVTSIGVSAFSGCKGLTSIDIPNSVTNIGYQAFYNCSGLTSINYDGTTTQWTLITKGGNWKVGVPSNCMVHCTDGDIAI